MIKTLLKKQLSELFAAFFAKMKKSKKSSAATIALFAILMVFIIASFSIMFFSIGIVFADAFASTGLDWFYFALFGILATMLGVVGSVFMTHSMVYDAKDNELLLSMPIKPSYILFVRIAALYVIDFIFEALVLIPSYVAYAIFAGVTAMSVVGFIITVFVLPVFALSISLILGFLVALISSRLKGKGKSLIVMIISVGFFAVYYYFCFKMQEYLTLIIANSDVIGEKIKTFVYPVYSMGRAVAGDAVSLLIFVAIVGAVFGIIYFILSKSFIKISTSKRSGAKVKYKEKAYKAGSAGAALLKKEFSFLWSSPTYMLNCVLGSAFFLLLAVFSVIKRDVFTNMLDIYPGMENMFALMGVAVLCFIATMNPITAPSISLEGKTLWLLRSSPVSSLQVLNAKFYMHIILTAPFALIASLCLFFSMKADIFMTIAGTVFVLLFVVFYAAIGILLNLKFPKFDWTNHSVAVKQSMSVILSMLIGWAVMILLTILYIFTGKYMDVEIFMIIAEAISLVLAGGSVLLMRKQGVKMFEKL